MFKNLQIHTLDLLIDVKDFDGIQVIGAPSPDHVWWGTSTLFHSKDPTLPPVCVIDNFWKGNILLM